MAKKSEAKAAQEAPAPLVKMVRNAEQFPEPHSADVHPDEVENYAAFGWVVV